MSKTTLNAEGESSALALIRAGHYDMATPWSFSAEDGNALLGPNGDDWDRYGRWHLGEDPSEKPETKEHWKYPYGKDGKVYRRALANIRSRASQNGDDTVFDAAGRLMTAMDEEEEKKESKTMNLRTTLLNSGSRFAHFLAPSTRRAEGEEPEGSEAASAEDEEARKRAEEEEARKARRARRARKAKKREPDGEEDADGDDAADDGEDDDDEADMKKAFGAGHEFALDGAFRMGARAQRRRCAAIFADPAAAANPMLAMTFAFETNMTAEAAIAALKRQPAPAATAPGGLRGRMAASPGGGVHIGAGAPPAPSGPAAVAKSWDSVMASVAPQR